jgi:hypothetical protein
LRVTAHEHDRLGRQRQRQRCKASKIHQAQGPNHHTSIPREPSVSNPNSPRPTICHPSISAPLRELRRSIIPPDNPPAHFSLEIAKKSYFFPHVRLTAPLKVQVRKQPRDP